MEFYQTGDVLYIKTKKLPKEAKELKTDLFHKGENHQHKVRGDFSIYDSNEGTFLECKGPCDLYHEEHSTIVAEPGIYQKRIVVEFDHLLEESRQVVD